MDRRTYLGTLSATALGGAAGCLGVGGNPNTTLGEPDRPEGVTSEALAYPAWGERVPDVTLPDPLTDERIDLREVDRPTFVSFFYSNCMSVCPRLVSALREVQIHSVENGYADEVGFYPITFDPQRDTSSTLREYADRMNVDLSAGNWHFLRPDGRERAKTVLEEEFGFVFKRDEPDDGGKYMFTHIGLVLLVNADGYVERAYRDREGTEGRYIADLERVRSGGGGLL
ncbi:SCO family protein [Haloplanus rubicundus]|uniref:SCO family protein n=1 Tax=Haloplanus rubicundus TaxID=1547898 RepID=A0A345E5S2_9EURY|nr:SCO family protein [Haloplanus rubicundus]AXG07544.1 SCO family protein [Haloplanus rubicundus]